MVVVVVLVVPVEVPVLPELLVGAVYVGVLVGVLVLDGVTVLVFVSPLLYVGEELLAGTLLLLYEGLDVLELDGIADLTVPPLPVSIDLVFEVLTLGLAEGMALLELETDLSIAAEPTFLELPSLALEL